MINDPDLMQKLIEKEIYMMPKGLVREDDNLSITKEDAVGLCYGVAQSKFGYGSKKYNNQNVLIGDFDSGIQIFFARENTNVLIKSMDIKLPLMAGELLIAKTDPEYYVFEPEKIISLIYGIGFEEQFVGNGPNSYEVTCTIRDTYKVKVRANNVKEAKAIANATPIHSWKHPDIEEDLHKNRVLIRLARWGDLSVTEIGKKE